MLLVAFWFCASPFILNWNVCPNGSISFVDGEGRGASKSAGGARKCDCRDKEYCWFPFVMSPVGLGCDVEAALDARDDSKEEKDPVFGCECCVCC